MSYRVVIPARMQSSRLPGKPLADIAGRPMVRHVYDRAVDSGAAEVVVATDDVRVEEAVKAFGGQVVMTSPDHASGSERIDEVCKTLGWDADQVVVNLQGDEPLVPPSLIHQVAETLERDEQVPMSTLCYPIHNVAELFDPHVVKVVFDGAGHALYFSRATIPWDRDAFALSRETLPDGAEHYRHIGLYAYRAGFLADYVQWPACPLEQMESLEQLRVLYHGRTIAVAVASEMPGHGVDTPEDLQRVRAVFAGGE
jgi:3-deoxy-manno-octulosonate cytidylyltransferase (CMP-KDO synthetase)